MQEFKNFLIVWFVIQIVIMGMGMALSLNTFPGATTGNNFVCDVRGLSPVTAGIVGGLFPLVSIDQAFCWQNTPDSQIAR